MREEAAPSDNLVLAPGPSLHPHILKGLVSLQAVLAEGTFPVVSTGWAVLGRILRMAQGSEPGLGPISPIFLSGLRLRVCLQPPGLLGVLPTKHSQRIYLSYLEAPAGSTRQSTLPLHLSIQHLFLLSTWS